MMRRTLRTVVKLIAAGTLVYFALLLSLSRPETSRTDDFLTEQPDDLTKVHVDDREIRIVSYGNILGQQGAVDGCSVKCMIVPSTEENLRSADAVVFHTPSMPSITNMEKPKHQKWVAWSMESVVYYRQLSDPEYLSNFDYRMTYELNSDIPTLYCGPRTSLLSFSLPTNKSNEVSPIAFFASNCEKERANYVEELMNYIPVDSYGSCLNNMESVAYGGGAKVKRDILRKYKFYLAFENSRTNDYVTEKIYDGFMSGTLPVYRGAPNIDDFVPSIHSFVNADDFSNPKELAEYLKLLLDNQRLYDNYFKWKYEEPREKFKNLMKISSVPPECRLCVLLNSEKKAQVDMNKKSIK